MRTGIRILTGILAVVCSVLWGLVCWMNGTLPDRYWVTESGVVQLSPLITATATQENKAITTVRHSVGSNYHLTLRLFDCIPLKSAVATVVDTPVVIPCGTPFGIKMYTEGVLVVGMTDVQTAVGLVNPAQKAGIRTGDVILSMDGQPVNTTGEVAAYIENCGGRTIEVRIRRDNLTFTVRFTPARCVEDSSYKAGLWVRDSSAGIGTMTFYDPETGYFGGLGHGVCDVDTGDLLPISTGEVVPARIFDVVAGVSGTPGELCGTFEPGTLGTLVQNGENGVYGTLRRAPVLQEAMPIALKQQVKKGKVQILTTLDGTTPAWYEAEIEQVRLGDGGNGRNMVLHITDETLLACTGGIVQGMSGSPIVQDGKLVGAVTHVFVNDPTRGYGIFAENMLETAQSVAEKQQFKKVS